MSDLKAFGRVGAKAMAYFLTFSTLALVVGLVVANIVRPGEGLNVDPAALDQGGVSTYVSQAHDQTITGFLLHIIPDTFFSAFTSGRSSRSCSSPSCSGSRSR
jgi:aerobic C4-dicarboxylate transport protein